MEVLDIVLTLLFFGWLLCIWMTINSIDRGVQELIRDLHGLSSDISRLQRSTNQLLERPNRFYVSEGNK